MDLLGTVLFEGLASLADLGTAAAIGIGMGAVIWKCRTFARAGRGENLGNRLVEIRLALGSWLALALEFALAADILRTVMVPTWDEIGKLAAIVVLRTVLNFFLGREIEQGRRKAGLALPAAA
jgi:uncharacterized membrane protein